MKTNMELFDIYTADILARLYQSFPVPCTLDLLQISGCDEVDDCGNMNMPARICGHTVEWLADNGYLKVQEQHAHCFLGAVLTVKGLTLLKAVPDSVNGKSSDSMGDKLIKALKGGAVETAKAIVKAVLAQGVQRIL